MVSKAMPGNTSAGAKGLSFHEDTGNPGLCHRGQEVCGLARESKGVSCSLGLKRRWVTPTGSPLGKDGGGVTGAENLGATGAQALQDSQVPSPRWGSLSMEPQISEQNQIPGQMEGGLVSRAPPPNPAKFKAPRKWEGVASSHHRGLGGCEVPTSGHDLTQACAQACAPKPQAKS